MNRIIHGDNLKVLKTYPDNFFDSIVTDPPYGLKFMNKGWDYAVPKVDVWKEVFRVLKPGGHLLSFGGTRTYHRLVVAIEDAGFEIRDQIQWVYGSGFPKSLDISKAIDKAAGAEREVTGQMRGHVDSNGVHDDDNYEWKPIYDRKDIPTTDSAKQWQGWGTALKPANEPIVLARKPLSEKTVASNVLKWGTGGLNIDGCRIEIGTDTQGRFPANLLLDEEAAQMLDEQSLDSGGASRFFYVAKASKRERGEGNVHPTVKPIKLMEYLCKLITPPGGIILDPFMGSGSTLVAAKNLGFDAIGIELQEDYVQIAKKEV